VKQLVVAHGQTLLEIASEQAAIDSAEATLASPDSVNLAGEQLAKLNQVVRHTPMRVKTLKKTALRLADELRTTVAAHEINFDALVKHLVENPPGESVTLVRRLANAGLLAYPT